MLIRTKRSHAVRCIALGALVFALLSAVSGCEKASLPAAEQTVPKVTTADVIQQETTDFDEYTGETEASEAVEIRARAFRLPQDDRVQRRRLRQGRPDAVHDRAGRIRRHPQAIALQDRRLGIQAGSGQGEFGTPRKRDGDRQRRGQPRGISKSMSAAVREAEANLNAAKADANRTAVDLKYTVVKAPISGRIDRALVTKGTLLTGGVGLGHAADEDRQRAADVRLLRRR